MFIFDVLGSSNLLLITALYEWIESEPLIKCLSSLVFSDNDRNTYELAIIYLYRVQRKVFVYTLTFEPLIIEPYFQFEKHILKQRVNSGSFKKKYRQNERSIFRHTITIQNHIGTSDVATGRCCVTHLFGNLDIKISWVITINMTQICPP